MEKTVPGKQSERTVNRSITHPHRQYPHRQAHSMAIIKTSATPLWLQFVTTGYVPERIRVPTHPKLLIMLQ